LNLRPPGPQPERSRRTRCDSALSSGLSCSELRSVALNLHPRLHPRRRERSSSPGAGHALQCWSRRSPARLRFTLMRPCIGEPLRRLLVVRSERELGAVGDARVFRGAAVLPPALPDRPLLRFVQGSRQPIGVPARPRCSLEARAAARSSAWRTTRTRSVVVPAATSPLSSPVKSSGAPIFAKPAGSPRLLPSQARRAACPETSCTSRSLCVRQALLVPKTGSGDAATELRRRLRRHENPIGPTVIAARTPPTTADVVQQCWPRPSPRAPGPVARGGAQVSPRLGARSPRRRPPRGPLGRLRVV
jgi:hypothetical protein